MRKSSLPRIAFDQGFKRIKVSGDSVERDRTKLEKSRITFYILYFFRHERYSEKRNRIIWSQMIRLVSEDTTFS